MTRTLAPLPVDVRTPGEFSGASLPDSLNVPLADIDRFADRLREEASKRPLLLVCRTGRRAETARDRLRALGVEYATVLEGGIEAWIAGGGDVVRGEAGMSIERQVRVAAGSLVLVGVGLGAFVHPGFLGLAAFVGAGLVFAGLTDTCGMALLLGRLPFNRVSAPAAAALVAAVLLGCGSAEEEVSVRALDVEGLENAHIVEDFVLSSQPTPAALEVLRDTYGVRTVVDLRLASETPDFDEEAAVRKAGLEYLGVPFKQPDTLTDDVFGRLRKILSDPERRPVLVHCKSGNRVGAIWYARRVLDDGLSTDVAMAEARTVGLRKEGHIARAEAYVASRKK